MTDHPQNRLKDSASPYLRSASHQPIDWHEWGAAAFARAKSEDKPILLDIGAVWCHWCHVIDRESYENPEIAKIINGNFIAVKVDDVAPVAPDGADVEEDGFVFGFGTGEDGIAPFVPIDGLVGGGTEVRAGGIFEAVLRMVGHGCSLVKIAKREELRCFASLRMTPLRKNWPG